ncbi:hypothetical protein LTR36_008200 [Oleoguttula mirabilis]|uniref:Major facilitator superfamily (MFS) profile domain-containing protein n=1 Tax=Oleoguttula mirabilis TaxID=1507867 RepID=A0AAV9J883_9PEZI|nr:hypothetical protein LTR36_008200 [Oleoguttula mirabilis]
MASLHATRSPDDEPLEIGGHRYVPGTEMLYDSGMRSQLSTLQHVKKGDSHILLVPQPSLTDPNDPLCWSNAKKWITLLNGIWYSFNGAITGPIMAAGMIGLTVTFDTTLQRMTYANGATLACQGAATTLWMPFAVKYGRRPVYLLSNLLMLVACIWLGIAATGTYTPFIIGRAFLGIFEAPIEALCPSTVTDLFFLHERGEKVSLYGLSVLSGNELGPVASAFIIQSLGMKWAFFIVAMFIGASLISMFLTMPETRYSGSRPTLHASQDPGECSSTKSAVYHHEKLPEAGTQVQHIEQQETVDRSTYLQGLKFWSKGEPTVNLLHTFVRPFVLLAYPTVAWSSLIYGLSLSWNVILGATTAQLFAPPPYGFDSSAQGLVFLSPFIGSLVGTYVCGPFADTVANYYTKRNDGVREPEMRLPTCAIAAIITFIGAVIAGVTYHYGTHWAGPVVGYGILSAGAQMGATLAMTYSLDCHKELSAELMVTISVVKSLIAWIWTWFINEWIISSGVLTVFCIIAAINVAAYLTTLILYWKGKDIRAWIQKKDLIGLLGVN